MHSCGTTGTKIRYYCVETRVGHKQERSERKLIKVSKVSEKIDIISRLKVIINRSLCITYFGSDIHNIDSLGRER